MSVLKDAFFFFKQKRFDDRQKNQEDREKVLETTTGKRDMRRLVPDFISFFF